MNTATNPETSPAFSKWIDQLVSEKGIDLEQYFEAMGPSGSNLIPYGSIVELMKVASRREQATIKATIVKIDFVNGDVRHYMRHLGKAVAK